MRVNVYFVYTTLTHTYVHFVSCVALCVLTKVEHRFINNIFLPTWLINFRKIGLKKVETKDCLKVFRSETFVFLPSLGNQLFETSFVDN